MAAIGAEKVGRRPSGQFNRAAQRSLGFLENSDGFANSQMLLPVYVNVVRLGSGRNRSGFDVYADFEPRHSVTPHHLIRGGRFNLNRHQIAPLA